MPPERYLKLKEFEDLVEAAMQKGWPCPACGQIGMPTSPCRTHLLAGSYGDATCYNNKCDVRIFYVKLPQHEENNSG